MELHYNDEVKALVLEENGNRFQAIVSDGVKSDIATITRYWFESRELEITKDISLIKAKVIEMCRESISTKAKNKIKELFPAIDEELKATIEKEEGTPLLLPNTSYSLLAKLPAGTMRAYPLPSDEEINSLIFIRKKIRWQDTDWNESLGVSKKPYTAFYQYKYVYEALPKLKEALSVYGYTDLKEVERNELTEKVYKLYGNKEATFQERAYNYGCYYKIRLAMASSTDPNNEDKMLKAPKNTAFLQLPDLKRFQRDFNNKILFYRIFYEYVIGIIEERRYKNISHLIKDNKKVIKYLHNPKKDVKCGEEYYYYMSNLIDKEECIAFFSKLGCLTEDTSTKGGYKYPEKWLELLDDAIQRGEVAPEKALFYLWSYANHKVNQREHKSQRRTYLKNTFFAPRALHTTFLSYLFRGIKERYKIDYKKGVQNVCNS